MIPDTMPSGATRARILIGDDCATSRLVQERILRHTGHEIMMASDGVEVVEAARSQAPDLILLDLRMPRVGGLEALRELKRSPQTRHVPVVVVTVCGDTGAFKQAAESGCSAFLTKPFDADALLMSVERNLAMGSRTRSPNVATETPTGSE
jgi:CheY-like chemotaxis protein